MSRSEIVAEDLRQTIQLPYNRIANNAIFFEEGSCKRRVHFRDVVMVVFDGLGVGLLDVDAPAEEALGFFDGAHDCDDGFGESDDRTCVV